MCCDPGPSCLAVVAPTLAEGSGVAFGLVLSRFRAGFGGIVGVSAGGWHPDIPRRGAAVSERLRSAIVAMGDRLRNVRGEGACAPVRV
jgi:hypothetical protein